MWEIFDSYCWTKQKKVLTYNEHHVKGLGNFTFWSMNTSFPPSPMHIHSDIIEIHCMIKGTRYTQVEKGGNIYRYTMSGNQAMLVFPFEIHSNGNQPQQPCEFYAFQVNVKDPYHLLGLDPEYSRALYSSLMTLKHPHVQLSQSHLNHLRMAFNFFSERKEESIHIGVQFLTAFLFTLQYLEPINTISEDTMDPGLQKTIQYVNANLNQNLALEELAAVSGYSLSRFKVKFRDSVGITPAEFITLKKLEEAKRRLVYTDDSITDIAFALGFSSSNYFSAVFKKLNSCTPKHYRSLYLSKKGKGDLAALPEAIDDSHTTDEMLV